MPLRLGHFFFFLVSGAYSPGRLAIRPPYSTLSWVSMRYQRNSQRNIRARRLDVFLYFRHIIIVCPTRTVVHYGLAVINLTSQRLSNNPHLCCCCNSFHGRLHRIRVSPIANSRHGGLIYLLLLNKSLGSSITTCRSGW